MLHCEVIETCFITGNVLKYNATNQEYERQAMHDHIVYPGTLVEVPDDTVLEVNLGAQVQLLRVIRKVPDVVIEAFEAKLSSPPQSEAEKMSDAITKAEGSSKKK